MEWPLLMSTSQTNWHRPPWTLGVMLALGLVACGRSQRSVGGPGATPPTDMAGRGGSAGTSFANGGSQTAGEAGDAAVGGGTRGGSAGSGGSLPCDELVPATSQIPRLTAAQYDRTLRELLGVSTLGAPIGGPPSSLLPPDSDNDMSDRDWAAYLATAEAVAAEVLADPASKANFIDCAPDEDTSTCLHDTIVRFGKRAFRRPLSPAEVARFEAIGARASEITEHGTLDEVAEVILETFLVSPSFLFRSEVTETAGPDGNFALSSYEVASRLSYFLWDSMPDEALEAVADTGALVSIDPIREQAERMLADPQARDQMRAFHRYYVEADAGYRWGVIDKSAERFPTFTSASVSAAVEETDRFFESIVFDGGTFADLLTSPQAFVSASTAAIYGLDPAAFGDSLEPVTLDATERPGFLTRIAFLASYAYRERNAIQLRGAFVERQVLGAAVGPQPPDVPLPGPRLLDTLRKNVEAEDASAACTGCHVTIDPPGFVFEGFDAVGARQTVESDTGAPIDTEADVDIDGIPVHVRDPAELMQALALSASARHRYAERWASFAYQRRSNADSCVIDQLADRLADPSYRVLSIPVALATSATFRARNVEP